MDKTFVKFVEDYTRDGWSFLSTPKELEIQKDDDFMHTFEYMGVETKVRRKRESLCRRFDCSSSFPSPPPHIAMHTRI